MEKDCRFFSGYKPCSLHHECSSQCPIKQVAHPRILIIHLEALGAVLRGTVILRAIKRKWPNSHVTWITSIGAASLLENNPLIDRILQNDHQGVLALSTLAFDYGFSLDKSLMAAGLLRIPVEIKEKRGFGVDSISGAIVPLNIEAQSLYELGLSDHKKFFVNKKSEAQLITESLGLNFQQDDYVFEFSKNELLENINLKKTLGLENFKGPIIGLNTGCSPTIRYKKFSVSGWVDLIGVLAKDFPRAKILLLGGREDTSRNAEIKAMYPDIISTPTTLGLRSGFQFVNICDVVVTGDSLGMHMAIALRKWVVAWFGPTCAHEIEFYGRGVAIQTKALCAPCWKRSCDKPKMCYDLVDWNEISKAVRLGLSRDKVFATTAKKLPEISL